jgi:hypothetical protein
MQIAATILIVVAKVATTVAMVLIVGHFVIKYW